MVKVDIFLFVSHIIVANSFMEMQPWKVLWSPRSV